MDEDGVGKTPELFDTSELVVTPTEEAHAVRPYEGGNNELATRALFGEVVAVGAGGSGTLGQPLGVVDLMQAWATEFENWLQQPRRSNPNTQRAYRKAWEGLLRFTDKMPWQITKSDVAGWMAAMRETGEQGRPLSEATVQQRLAGISSFYLYAQNDAEIVLPNGQRRGLSEHNPAGSSALRVQIDPYDKADGLSNEQTVAFLRVIRPNTVQGMRDHALFSLYVASGRRNTEVRTLQKKDIRFKTQAVEFHWAQKKGSGWEELPEDIWGEILGYLKAAGRAWETLGPEDYLFTALNDHAKTFKNVKAEGYDPQGQPLAMRQVLALCKKYARKAGLDPKLVHVHTLRHTTADLMIEQGNDVRDVQTQLGHKGLNTTQIYFTKKKGKKNVFWKTFKALNDL